MLTIPYRNWSCKNSLPGNAPVPFHGACPVLQPGFHILWTPVNIFCSSQNALMVDLHEPLGLGKDFYRGVATPAESNILRQRFMFIKETFSLQVENDSFSACCCTQAFIFACSFCHLSLLVDSFYKG